MQVLRRRVFKSIFPASSSSYNHSLGALRNFHLASKHSAGTPDRLLPLGFLVTPWSAVQNRGAKVLGTDVRPGNVIQRKDRIYQVLKAQHTQHGRGGATIQVELRDVDSGNKITERFRTDEAIEKVFVEEKSFTFLYTEGDSVMLMEPKTFEQIEVDKDLFGKAAAYLKGFGWFSLLNTLIVSPTHNLVAIFTALDEMKVNLQFYDGKPMSASVPTRVTCTVAEAQDPMKGITATPQYKKVLLDNGLLVLVPAFIRSGDQIVINTIEDTYITRAKE